MIYQRVEIINLIGKQKPLVVLWGYWNSTLLPPHNPTHRPTHCPTLSLHQHPTHQFSHQAQHSPVLSPGLKQYSSVLYALKAIEKHCINTLNLQSQIGIRICRGKHNILSCTNVLIYCKSFFPTFSQNVCLFFLQFILAWLKCVCFSRSEFSR